MEPRDNSQEQTSNQSNQSNQSAEQAGPGRVSTPMAGDVKGSVAEARAASRVSSGPALAEAAIKATQAKAKKIRTREDGRKARDVMAARMAAYIGLRGRLRIEVAHWAELPSVIYAAWPAGASLADAQQVQVDTVYDGVHFMAMSGTLHAVVRCQRCLRRMELFPVKGLAGFGALVAGNQLAWPEDCVSCRPVDTRYVAPNAPDDVAGSEAVSDDESYHWHGDDSPPGYSVTDEDFGPRGGPLPAGFTSPRDDFGNQAPYAYSDNAYSGPVSGPISDSEVDDPPKRPYVADVQPQRQRGR